MPKQKLLLACALLALGQPAFAASKSRTTLQSNYTSSLPDNTSGAITPSILRGVMADNANSNFNLLTDTLAVIPPTGTNGQIFFNSAGAIGGRSLSGLMDSIGATRGATLYRGVSGWAALVPGTTGNVLTSNGTGTDPTWQPVSGSDTGNVTGAPSSTDRTLPRFNGTAGTSGAYWGFSGSQNFTLAGTNPSYLANLQNDSENFWIAISVDLAASGSQFLWSTQGSSSTAGLTIAMSATTTPRFNMTQYGTASKQVLAYSPTNNAGTDYVVIVSHAAGGNTRLWANTAGAFESTVAFNAASVPASHAMTIGSRSISTYIGSGAKIRSFAIGTDYLTDTSAAAIMHRLETRHGIDYDGNGTVGG